MKKKRNSRLIVFNALCSILVIFFVALYIASNKPKPIIEQQKLYDEIDTVKNYYNTKEMNRINDEQEAKRKQQQLEKEYQEKILQGQIESDKKEMEYLKKRYLDPYEK